MSKPLVQVYRFKYFDRSMRAERISPDFATEESIVSMGATILRDTEMQVPDGEISHCGIWRSSLPDPPDR
jgi:hypothetical protein